MQKMLAANTKSVQLSADSLSAGVYILSLNNGKETTTYKIVKQ